MCLRLPFKITTNNVMANINNSIDTIKKYGCSFFDNLNMIIIEGYSVDIIEREHPLESINTNNTSIIDQPLNLSVNYDYNDESIYNLIQKKKNDELNEKFLMILDDYDIL